SEYIHRIQEDNNRQRNSIQLLQNQINILQSKVVELQNQLPECGISPSRKAGNFNDSQNPKLLCEFMKKKTSENWVFYIFSLIIMPMYQTFQATVNCNSTNHEFLEKIRQWKETNCRLSNFRSIASTAIIKLGHQTSIQNDPGKLPNECSKLAMHMFQ
ncbi:hypothetical protein GJ496_003518, partial [Pomphorhynchus laevis]